MRVATRQQRVERAAHRGDPVVLVEAARGPSARPLRLARVEGAADAHRRNSQRIEGTPPCLDARRHPRRFGTTPRGRNTLDMAKRISMHGHADLPGKVTSSVGPVPGTIEMQAPGGNAAAGNGVLPHGEGAKGPARDVASRGAALRPRRRPRRRRARLRAGQGAFPRAAPDAPMAGPGALKNKDAADVLAADYFEPRATRPSASGAAGAGCALR